MQITMGATLSATGRRSARLVRSIRIYDWRALGARLGRAAWNVALSPLFALGWTAGFVVRATKLARAALGVGFDAGRKL